MKKLFLLMAFMVNVLAHSPKSSPQKNSSEHGDNSPVANGTLEQGCQTPPRKPHTRSFIGNAPIHNAPEKLKTTISFFEENESPWKRIEKGMENLEGQMDRAEDRVPYRNINGLLNAPRKKQTINGDMINKNRTLIDFNKSDDKEKRYKEKKFFNFEGIAVLQNQFLFSPEARENTPPQNRNSIIVNGNTIFQDNNWRKHLDFNNLEKSDEFENSGNVGNFGHFVRIGTFEDFLCSDPKTPPQKNNQPKKPQPKTTPASQIR